MLQEAMRSLKILNTLSNLAFMENFLKPYVSFVGAAQT
jgi:hypothetical protein